MSWVEVAALVSSAGASICGAMYYMTRIEPKNFRLEHERVYAQGGWNGQPARTAGSAAQDPLRILHISDLHLNYPEKEKISFLRRLYDAEYDLVFLTGDVFENLSGLVYARDVLSARPKLGAYAVLGNHDYYNYNWVHKTYGKLVAKYRNPKVKRNVEPIVAALGEAGFQVLRNQSVTISDRRLHIVGIDYPGTEPSVLAELASRAPPEFLRIVLFHLPVNLADIASHKIHLAFGGHTHGGQIRIPGIGALVTDSELNRKQASGLHKIGDTHFHISRGIGADPKSNMRFFCPPAATVVEVHGQRPPYE